MRLDTLEALPPPPPMSTTHFDKDATIRSNRSARSARSMQHIVPDLRPFRAAAQPPPPPYQVSTKPHDLNLRRDASPSSMSLESARWDEASRNHRWSVWTADTTLHLSDEGGDEYEHEADGFDKNARMDEGGQSRRQQMMIELDGRQAGPSSSPYSQGSTPPSPTSEAALDAALSSTMLALTTANSLLLSTMSSRRELARLRALEAALDHDLTQREGEIKRQLESNRRTIRWMEKACRRLDDVIEGHDTGNHSITAEDLDDLTAIASVPSSRPSNIVMARHARLPSTATADAREVPIPFGIVEAKDENATVGKSAAKRLERMLQRAQGASDVNTPGSSRFAPQHNHSRTSSTLSSATSASGVDVDVNQVRPAFAAAAATKSSGLRHTSGNALQLKLSVGKSATHLTATTASAPSAGSTPISEGSLRRLEAASSSSRPNSSARSESEFSTAPSSSRGEATGEETSASRLLGSFMTTRPASKLSVENGGDTVARPSAITTSRTPSHIEAPVSRPTSSQFLTPPMPARELGEDGAASSVAGTPSLLHRPSMSSMRSPSALHVSGQGSGSGLSAADEARGVAAKDPQGPRKGALEALRRLNSNGAPGTGDSTSTPSNAASGDPLRGWGGTLASWMGISNNNDASTGPPADEEPHDPSLSTSAPRDAAFAAPDLAA